MTTQTASRFFALLSLLCVAAVVLVVLGALAVRSGAAPGWLLRARDDLRRHALAPAWLVAVVATAGSLYYSEVVGFVPCKLCWFQRIGMYPLAVILGVATVRRDASVRWYALPLAGIGATVATYHTWLQAFPDRSSAFCTLEAPCTDRHVWELGFVSLPFMALSAFAFVIAMLLVARPAGSDPQLDPPTAPELEETRP